MGLFSKKLSDKELRLVQRAAQIGAEHERESQKRREKEKHERGGGWGQHGQHEHGQHGQHEYGQHGQHEHGRDHRDMYPPGVSQGFGQFNQGMPPVSPGTYQDPHHREDWEKHHGHLEHEIQQEEQAAAWQATQGIPIPGAPSPYGGTYPSTQYGTQGALGYQTDPYGNPVRDAYGNPIPIGGAAASPYPPAQYAGMVNVMGGIPAGHFMPTAVTQGDRLLPGQAIAQGQSITSANGQYKLAMQSDGNAVIYSGGSAPTWATNTVGKGGVNLVMQNDGNLVMYTGSGQAVWASGSNGNGGAYVAMQNDGNLVVYTAGGQKLWASQDPVKSGGVDIGRLVAFGLTGGTFHPLLASAFVHGECNQTNAQGQCWDRNEVTGEVGSRFGFGYDRAHPKGGARGQHNPHYSTDVTGKSVTRGSTKGATASAAAPPPPPPPTPDSSDDGGDDGSAGFGFGFGHDHHLPPVSPGTYRSPSVTGEGDVGHSHGGGGGGYGGGGHGGGGGHFNPPPPPSLYGAYGAYPLGVALLDGYDANDWRVHGEYQGPTYRAEPMGHGNPFDIQGDNFGFGAEGDTRLPIYTTIDGRQYDPNTGTYLPPAQPYVRDLTQGGGTVKIYDDPSQMGRHGSAGFGLDYTHGQFQSSAYPSLSGTRPDEPRNQHTYAPGTSDYLNHRRATFGMNPFGYEGGMTDAAKQMIIDEQNAAEVRAQCARSAYEMAVGNDRERPRPHFDPKAKAMSSGNLQHGRVPPNVQDLHGGGGHSNMHYTTGTRPAQHDAGAMNDLNNRRAQGGRLLL